MFWIQAYCCELIALFKRISFFSISSKHWDFHGFWPVARQHPHRTKFRSFGRFKRRGRSLGPWSPRPPQTKQQTQSKHNTHEQHTQHTSKATDKCRNIHRLKQQQTQGHDRQGPGRHLPEGPGGWRRGAQPTKPQDPNPPKLSLSLSLSLYIYMK